MGKSLMSLAAVAAVALTVHADTYYWVNGSTDWANENSYTNQYGETGFQAYKDELAIPADTTAVLRYSDTESWAFASDISVIRPLTATSYLVVYVDNDDVATLNAKINFDGTANYAAWMKGGLVKRGTGTLILGSGENHWDYFVDMTVEEGTLKLPQNVSKWSWRYYDVLKVNAGATLFICGADGQGAALTAPLGLEGEGTVTCDPSAGCNWLEIQGGGRLWSHEFAGKLTGNIKILNAQTHFYLTGTENTFSGGSYGNLGAISDGTKYTPVIGLKKIGLSTDAASSAGAYNSSFGLGFRDDRDWKRDHGGTGYLYLGTGETTDKRIYVYSTTTAPVFFDAGAVGGLTFTGELAMGAKEQQRFVITGSNTQECVVSGPIKRNTDWDTTPYTYYNWRIIKKGTGTWHFTDVSNNEMAGVFAVEDGTLKFDSIADAGTLCSLGLATQLYDDYSGALDPAHVVSHAFELGREFDDAAAPVFEYTGVGGEAWCYTRPIALAGNATIRNSGTDELRLSGVAPLLGATEPKTLTLDGTGTKGYLLNVTDTDGNLSLVKAGPGTWTVGGTNTVSGAVKVLGGTLVVQNVGTPFTWFRWIHKKTYNHWQSREVELGLYAADGTRQNGGLTFNSTCTYLPAHMKGLRPGQFAYGANLETYQYKDDNYKLFNGNGMEEWAFAFFNRDTASGWTQANPDDPTTWFKLVMRLPEGAEAITSFDLLDKTDYDGCRGASKVFALEGSVDGLTWEPFFDYADDAATAPQTSGKNLRWRFGGETYATDGVPPTADEIMHHTTGRPIAAKSTALTHGSVSPLADVDEIALGNGGTLEVVGDRLALKNGITLTLAGPAGGTLKNVALPAAGTLNFASLPSAAMVGVTVARENVAGYDNLKDWSLAVNGADASEKGYSVMFEGDRIVLKKPALSLLLK